MSKKSFKKTIGGLVIDNGDYETGLDVARYVNAFPGNPGDYRAWIGGIRPCQEIDALLNNLQFAYHRAKIVVLEEQLAELGETFPCTASPAKTSSTATEKQLQALRTAAQNMATFWGALEATKDPSRRAQLIQCYGDGLKSDAQAYAQLMMDKSLAKIWAIK